jgi:hypothetical protein
MKRIGSDAGNGDAAVLRATAFDREPQETKNGCFLREGHDQTVSVSARDRHRPYPKFLGPVVVRDSAWLVDRLVADRVLRKEAHLHWIRGCPSSMGYLCDIDKRRRSMHLIVYLRWPNWVMIGELFWPSMCVFYENDLRILTQNITISGSSQWIQGNGVSKRCMIRLLGKSHVAWFVVLDGATGTLLNEYVRLDANGQPITTIDTVYRRRRGRRSSQRFFVPKAPVGLELERRRGPIGPVRAPNRCKRIAHAKRRVRNDVTLTHHPEWVHEGTAWAAMRRPVVPTGPDGPIGPVVGNHRRAHQAQRHAQRRLNRERIRTMRMIQCSFSLLTTPRLHPQYALRPGPLCVCLMASHFPECVAINHLWQRWDVVIVSTARFGEMCRRDRRPFNSVTTQRTLRWCHYPERPIHGPSRSICFANVWFPVPTPALDDMSSRPVT